MAILTQTSSDVTFNEIDLSQILVQESTANAGIVFVSSQGREGLFHSTAPDIFLSEYGNPNAAISFGHYCSLDYHREGNSLWCLRVLGTGYAYSAALLSNTAADATLLAGVSGGVATPNTPAWTTLEGANTALVLFWPKHGPGSYGNNIAVSINSDNLVAPAAPVLTQSTTGGDLTAALLTPTAATGVGSTTGGTLAAATYYVKIVAVDAFGNTTQAGAESTGVTTTGSTSSISYTWTAVTGATSYQIWFGTATNAESEYFTSVSTSFDLVSSTGTTGTLPVTNTTGTYAYKISAVSKAGESLASSEITTVVASGSTNTVILTWTAEAGAIGFNVYGRVGGKESLIASVGGGTYTYTDTGSVTPGAQLPITVASNQVLVNTFTVNVFDLTVSSSTPAESFPVSLVDQVDSTGVQMEITQRINPFSQYINVSSNAPSLVTIPTIWGYGSSQALTGGTSGTAPTNSEIQAAWTTYFSSRDLVDVDILINGGYTDVGIQQNLDSIATSRATSIALLDVPATSQSGAQGMIDYRNLTLNLNSSFSALFGPDVLESDPYNGTALYVPFSGWAAALCARTDRVAQTWYSIAGLNRGLVNVLGIRPNPVTGLPGFDQGDRNALFAAQINFTRNFVGAGIALWEQTTLEAKVSALRWLSVRRLVNAIKKSTYQFLLYSLEEPNDDFVRRSIVSGISDYLELIMNAQGISDYLVVSDATNNPSSLTGAGILKVTVFITPIIPIHQIQVDLVITKQGVTYSEINIQQLP